MDQTGITCEIDQNLEISNMDQKHAITIFRIFQEALTNIVRHANATKVTATFKKNAGKLVMEVRDNGRGITKEQMSNPQSLGLIGIRERVNLLKGKVVIRGIQDKGTTVFIEIPLDKSRRKKQTEKKAD